MRFAQRREGAAHVGFNSGVTSLYTMRSLMKNDCVDINMINTHEEAS